jgi:hypothetical protein
LQFLLVGLDTVMMIFETNICLLIRSFSCLSNESHPVTDEVGLQGGNYGFFGNLTGDGEILNFDNQVSSFVCSTVTGCP